MKLYECDQVTVTDGPGTNIDLLLDTEIATLNENEAFSLAVAILRHQYPGWPIVGDLMSWQMRRKALEAEK